MNSHPFALATAVALAVSPVPFVAAFQASGEAAATQGDGRALPYSRGRRFATLDEYLRYLRSNAAIDLPYYREIRPGVYVEVSSFRPLQRGRATSRTYTRRELMRMFGFTQ